MSALLAPATTLWAHQQAGVEYALARKGAMLAMPMGHGKSLTTIEVLRRRRHMLTVILCPKSVVSHWPLEFAKHAPGEYQVTALDRGTVKERTETARLAVAAARHLGQPCVVVTNHEAAWRSPFAEWLATSGAECLVVDELHRAKAPGGKFSRFLGRLVTRIPYRLGLTGTPMPHSPLDVYAQFRFLNPSVYGTSYVRFQARYAILGGFEGRQVVGYQNEAEFVAGFRSVAYESDPKAVELPPTLDVRRGFLLPPAARKLYRDVEREFYAELDEGTITAGNALVRLLRLQQITGGSVRDDDGTMRQIHNEKATLFADVLEDLAPREPVVVFARFRQDLDSIRSAALADGRTVSELSGRANELQDWQDAKTDVLAVQIQAGGVGVDLTRARYCFYYSLGFSLSDYLQSRARVHRPGQTRHVTYLHLLALGTVDERVYTALERRQDVIDAILGRRV